MVHLKQFGPPTPRGSCRLWFALNAAQARDKNPAAPRLEFPQIRLHKTGGSAAHRRREWRKWSEWLGYMPEYSRAGQTESQSRYSDKLTAAKTVIRQPTNHIFWRALAGEHPTVSTIALHVPQRSSIIRVRRTVLATEQVVGGAATLGGVGTGGMRIRSAPARPRCARSAGLRLAC